MILSSTARKKGGHTMKFYCGIDLHAKDSYLCVIDDQGKTHLKSKVTNHLEDILDQLSSFSPRPFVAVESTLNWYWLVDGLEEAGFEVKLAHTLGLYMITGAKVKTDRRDALTLAKLLRLDALPEAYIYPKDKRPIRDLLRRRNRVVSVRAAGYVALRGPYSNPVSLATPRIKSSVSVKTRSASTSIWRI
jgi:transposase